MLYSLFIFVRLKLNGAFTSMYSLSFKGEFNMCQGAGYMKCLINIFKITLQDTPYFLFSAQVCLFHTVMKGKLFGPVSAFQQTGT